MLLRLCDPNFTVYIYSPSAYFATIDVASIQSFLKLLANQNYFLKLLRQ